VIADTLAALAVATAPVPVGVGAREYRFGVYRHVVPRGAVRFNLHDFGEDAHNLMVFGPGGYRSAASPDVNPGADVSFQVRLARRGTYRLVCVKPGHATRGMRATLKVR